MGIVCALIVAGCGGLAAQQSLYERLQSDDHAVRAAAVVEAGNARDPKATPYLVDRLEDDDADIRLFAGEALRRITGQDLGYRSYDSPQARSEAVRRWRQWLSLARGEGDPP